MMKSLLFAAIIGFALAELEHHASDPEVIEHNPEEGDFFEGDMLMPYNPFTRNAKIGDTYKWPGATVYYEVDPTGFAASDLAQIEKAINVYHTKTCIRFVKRTTQTYWVKISRASAGCFATVGKVSRNNNPQRINLGRGCTTRIGTVVHEMAHMLGFHHEQSRPDRDQYVTIMTANIQSGKANNFRKYTTSQVTTLNLPYDYGSVMHYNSHGFSNNGQPTIVPKKAGVTIGQRNAFSALDIQKLNAYYCNGKTGAPVSTNKPVSTSRPVTNPPVSGSAFSCNFASSTCGMTQSTADQLDWTRISGATGSQATGPSSGQYLYVEASGKAANLSATILTPAVSATAGKYALRFRYHMYGASMGSLRAYFVMGSRQYNYFSKSGDQGNAWMSSCTTLTVSGAATIRMGFTGVVGSSFKSDMAIDDVSIAKGECGSTPVSTTPKAPVTTGQTLLSCTFDQNTCGMTMSPTTGFAFIRKTGPTGSANTGPTSDANGNAAGFYVYTEASGPATGATATMTTPLYTLTGGTGCLEFSFHMYGAAMGKLNVYYQLGSQARRSLYARAGDNGNRWLRTRININGAQSQIKFIFESIRGSSFTSDVALDNIVLKNQAC